MNAITTSTSGSPVYKGVSALKKFLSVALMASTIILPASAQKFGTKGGVGANDSTYQSGEPTGGTYSINGLTGSAKLGAITSTGTITATNINGSVSGTNTGDQTSVSGNAGTADKLKTSRTINGVPFDGSANITVNATDTITRLSASNNLSDIQSAAAARINLGVSATGTDTGYAWRSNNLSDIGNPITARNNIGAAASGVNTDIASISGSAAKWTTARMISSSGDASWSVSVDGSVSVAAPITFATVNATPGTYGSSLQVPVIAVNGKGLITSVSSSALGTAASVNTGTSGDTIPLLSGTNTWTSTQTINGTLTVDKYGDDTFTNGLSIRKLRGTALSPTTVNANDVVSAVSSWAYDGTALRRVSGIRTLVSATPSGGFIPGVMRFSLSSPSTNDATVATLSNDGSFALIGGLSATTGQFSSTIAASNFTGSSSGTNTGDQTNITGNAGTATKLAIARTINGVPFDGTANITISNAGATQAYSEGTFLPALLTEANATGATYSPRSGRYTRIGRLVTVEFDFAILDKGFAYNGNVYIGGLPFPAAPSIRTGTGVIGTTGAQGLAYMGEIDPNTSSIRVLSVTEGSVNSADYSYFSNGSRIYGSFTYSTSAP
jgi:hypothetical protein